MSTGHPGDYGNAIMQKQGFFHRPAARRYGARRWSRRAINASTVSATDQPFGIDAKFHADLVALIDARDERKAMRGAI
jgi:hypothetical protein